MIKSFIAAIAVASVATAASAVTLVNIPASTGELASPMSTSVTFKAAGGMAVTDFVVQGFGSLDGVNPYQDTFTLSLNGTDIYSASFDLGGNGANTVFLAAPGATYSLANVVFFHGGEATINTPLALTAGTNTLRFRYNGKAQGLRDEAWGIRALTVTGATVPEPAAWALLVVGFGLVGSAARRRKVSVAA